MITKFALFEDRFSDTMKILGTSSLADILKDQKQKEFQIDREFQKYISINKKIRFHVIWNQSEAHDIYQRILNRKISVKSITELNNKIKEILTKIPELVENQEIFVTGKYGLILTESNFCVIIFIDMKKYLNKDYEIEIKTILPMTAIKGVIREIKLDL